MLSQLRYRQIVFDHINAVVIWGSFNDFSWFTICKDDGLRDFERTAHVGAIGSASKFLDEPIIVLLFICKVVAFVELYCLILCDAVHLEHDSLFDCVVLFCFLLLDIVAMFSYFFV